jgi:hypothetical protein
LVGEAAIVASCGQQRQDDDAVMPIIKKVASVRACGLNIKIEPFDSNPIA